MYLPFSLSNPVSRQRWNYHNRPMDTLKVQMGLEQLGFMEPRDDDTYVSTDSDRLFGAMMDFQKANGLEVDGIANPDGPTHQAMNKALSASAAHRPAKPLIARPIPAAERRRPAQERTGHPGAGQTHRPRRLPGPHGPNLAVQERRGRRPRGRRPAAPDLREEAGNGPEDARIELAAVMDETSMRHIDDAARIPPGDREPPQRPLLSDLQAVEEMRDGIPDLDDLEDKTGEPSEDDGTGATEAKTEWKQQPTLFQEQGGTEVITYGPIRFELHTRTTGLDGFRYYVEWHPLDEEGAPRQVATSSDSTPEPLGGQAILGRPKREDSVPPYHNPHGWQVKINIPSQPQVHGNSAGNYLNIFTSDRKPDELM